MTENSVMSDSDQLQPSVFFRAFDIAFFVPGTLLFLVFTVCMSKWTENSTSVSSATNVAAGAMQSSKPLYQTLLDVQASQATTLTVLQIALFIVGAYVAGLFCHAISWSILNGWTKQLYRKPVSRGGRAWKGCCELFVFGSLKSGDEEEQMGLTAKPEADGETEDGQQNLAEQFDPPATTPDHITRLEPVEVDHQCWTSIEEHYVRRIDYFWYLRATCWNTAFAILLCLFMVLFTFSLGTTPQRWLIAVCLILVAALVRIGVKFGDSCRKRMAVCQRVADGKMARQNLSA